MRNLMVLAVFMVILACGACSSADRSPSVRESLRQAGAKDLFLIDSASAKFNGYGRDLGKLVWCFAITIGDCKTDLYVAPNAMSVKLVKNPENGSEARVVALVSVKSWLGSEYLLAENAMLMVADENEYKGWSESIRFWKER